jgi:hypothetical protein
MSDEQIRALIWSENDIFRKDLANTKSNLGDAIAAHCDRLIKIIADVDAKQKSALNYLDIPRS